MSEQTYNTSSGHNKLQDRLSSARGITSLFSNLLDNAVSAAETAAEHIIDFKINEKENTILSSLSIIHVTFRLITMLIICP